MSSPSGDRMGHVGLVEAISPVARKLVALLSQATTDSRRSLQGHFSLADATLRAARALVLLLLLLLLGEMVVARAGGDVEAGLNGG
jgi:hypothetical protein